MKFILIFVGFLASNPEAPAIMAHKSFANKIECERAAQALHNSNEQKGTPFRVATFCVEENDLLGIKHIS